MPNKQFGIWRVLGHVHQPVDCWLSNHFFSLVLCMSENLYTSNGKWAPAVRPMYFVAWPIGYIWGHTLDWYWQQINLWKWENKNNSIILIRGPYMSATLPYTCWCHLHSHSAQFILGGHSCNIRFACIWYTSVWHNHYIYNFPLKRTQICWLYHWNLWLSVKPIERRHWLNWSQSCAPTGWLLTKHLVSHSWWMPGDIHRSVADQWIGLYLFAHQPYLSPCLGIQMWTPSTNKSWTFADLVI